MNSAILSHLILGCALLAAPSLADAGSLRKVWEIQLEPIIKERAASGSASHTLNAINFSPDEQRLSVVVGMHPTERSFSSHLLILETKTPGAGSTQFELERGVFPGEGDSPDLVWSPDADTIAVSGVVISLRDGKACSFDTWKAWLGGYINSQTVVGRLTPAQVDLKHPSESFVLFSPHCELQDTWNVNDNWLIADVSPERGLAVVEQYSMHPSSPFGPPRGAVFLVDFRCKQVVRRWRADELLPQQVRFAEGGKTLCAAGGSVRPSAVPVRCVDVDTGKVIAEAASVKRGWRIVTADQSSRVVIAQYRPQSDNKPGTPVLDRRIVWDFRTGQQVATWHPEFQKWRFPIGEIKHWRSNPFVFAISPTGRYIAEGGNGVLRLYEIQP